MRKIVCLLFAVIAFALNASIAVFASSDRYNAVLLDNANCFTSSEEKEILALLNSLTYEMDCNIMIVTEDDLGGEDSATYARRMLNSTFGENSDSLVFLISDDFSSDLNFDFIDMTGSAFIDYYDRYADMMAAYYDGMDIGGYMMGVRSLCSYLGADVTVGGNTSSGTEKTEEADDVVIGYRAVIEDIDNVLTDDEEKALCNYLNPISDKISCNIGVVITDDLMGKSDVQYTDDFADKTFGYGSNNIVFLFNNDRTNMNYTDWISAYGLATYMYEYHIDDIFDDVYVGLDSGGGDNYYEGIRYFGSSLLRYYNADGYDDYNTDGDYRDRDGMDIQGLLIFIGISGGVSAIITVNTVKKYKRKAPVSARRYMDHSRARITERQDIFLRETTTHVRISSSSGGGGGSRGGGGGRSRSGRSGGGGRRR